MMSCTYNPLVIFLCTAFLFVSCKVEQVRGPYPEDQTAVNDLGLDDQCEAICGYELIYNFTKELQDFTAEIKVITEREQRVYSAVVSNGIVTSRSLLRDVFVTVLPNQIKIQYDLISSATEFEFTINGERLNPELQSSTPISVCGSLCALENYDLNTDNLDNLEIACEEECSGNLRYQFTNPLPEYDYQVVSGYYPNEAEVFAGRYENDGEQESTELPQNEYGITSIDYGVAFIQINHRGELDFQSLNININRIGKGQGAITESSTAFVCNSVCINAILITNTDEFLP